VTERRLAAILAADVAGFSAAMAEAEDATLAALQELRGVTDPIIEGHGGRIASTAGDSIVAEFPSVAEAVDAAVEIQRETAGGSLRMRIGVNLGDIIVTDDGDVFGDGVNIAARLESIAEVGGVVVSASVRDSLRGRSPVEFADGGLERLKHIDEPVHVYRALVEGVASVDPLPPVAYEEATLLERVDELRVMREALAAAGSGRGQVVLIGGEAGIGKSTLVRALAADASVDVLWGWCDDLVTPRALGPFYDMAPDLGAPFAAVLAGDPRPETVLAALHDQLATGPPRLVVVEDLHWADDATMDALTFLSRRIQRLPILLVVTVRDVGAARVRGALADAPPGSVHRLQPAPLSAAAIATMAGSAESAERLRRLTGGNPFFVSEVLASGSDTIPTSVQDAVLARLASLTDPARRLSEVVSVGPTRLESDVVLSVAGVEPDVADEAEQARIIVSADESLGFRHELARRAVEASLSDRDRRAINADVLATLEGLGADPARLVHHAAEAGDAAAVLRHGVAAAEAAGAVGAHHEAFAHWGRVVERGHLLDEDALLEALLGYSEEGYLIDAVEEAFEARKRRLEINERRSDALAVSDDLRRISRYHWYSGRGVEADEAAARAIEVLEELPPSRELAFAYGTRSQLLMLRGEDELAIVWGRRAVELAEELGDHQTRLHALTNIGTSLMRLSGERSEEGASLLVRVNEEARALGLFDDANRAQSNRTFQMLLARRYAEAEPLVRRGIEQAIADEHEGFRTYEVGQLAWLCMDTGRWDEALAHAEESLAGRAVATVARVPALEVMARILGRRGEFDEAHRIAEEAWSISRGTNEDMRMGPTGAMPSRRDTPIARTKPGPYQLPSWMR
jgi:tetratricopeptide (TPR) repeat protein